MALARRSLAALILLCAIPTFAWGGELAGGNELAGLWQEYDENTENLEALIRIEKLFDDSYEGKIEKIFPDTVENSALLCTRCTGSLRNHPLLGLRILSGMKRKDLKHFEEGEILDTDDGKTYLCHIRLAEDGNTIEITSYVNSIEIGQPEVWRRAN